MLLNAFMAGLLWGDGNPYLVAANGTIAVLCAVEIAEDKL